MSKSNFKQHDILIASSSEKMSESVARALNDGRYRVIKVRKSASHVRREVSDVHYDVCVVNMPLSDETGIDLAIDLSTTQKMGVIILSSAEHYDAVMEKVTDYGVVVIPKPAKARVVSMGVRLVCALMDKIHKSEKKAGTLEQKMEEIRLVNRAKWHLIDKEKMSENDAHRYIEKQAMDKCISRGEVAKEILGL